MSSRPNDPKSLNPEVFAGPTRHDLGHARHSRHRGARQSPLAEALFALDGISGVFFGSDFISVTSSGADWRELKPTVLGAIMEHFLSGAPLINEEAAAAAPDADGAEFFEAGDAETVAAIKQLMNRMCAPLSRATAATSNSAAFATEPSFSPSRARARAVRPRPRR